MTAAILTRETRWSCPNCTETSVTREANPHTRYHACRGLRGLSAPFVVDGTDCKVEAVERDDYVAGELVTCDGNGRPVMAVVTTRSDGSNDVAVFAPCATFRGDN